MFEVVKNNDVGNYYFDLIEVEVMVGDGIVYSVCGMFIGKINEFCIVGINGCEVEVVVVGLLLVFENFDKFGMVGVVGMLFG